LGPPLRIVLAEAGDRVVIAACGAGPPGRDARVFDAGSGQLLAEYGLGAWQVGPSPPFAVFELGGQTRLAIGEYTGVNAADPTGVFVVRQLDLMTGAPIGPEVGRPDRPAHVETYTLDGRVIIVVIGEDGVIEQYDAATGELALPVVRHEQFGVRSCALGADQNGRLLCAVGSRGGLVTVWDLAEAPQIWADWERPESAVDLSIGSVGETTMLAIARNTTSVEFRDAVTGQVAVGAVQLIGGDIPRIAVSHEGARPRLFVSDDEMLRHIDVESGYDAWPPMPWDDEIVHLLPAVLDGRELLLVAASNDVSKVDVVTGEVIRG
jgi:WD40 repeat protein